MREDAAGFKNSVIGPQIRSQPGQGPNTGRQYARSVNYLPPSSGMIILAFGLAAIDLP